MEEWQQRLLEEEEQLNARLEKLKRFLEMNSLTNMLNDENLSLLNNQTFYMQGYLSVLQKRIALMG